MLDRRRFAVFKETGIDVIPEVLDGFARYPGSVFVAYVALFNEFEQMLRILVDFR